MNRSPEASSVIPWKSRIGHLLHGADYYPEQWSREIWQRDVELMLKAGINAACLGVFAWSDLEPEEGLYRFEWLDEIVALLGRNGIDSILATPSGARPPWLAHRYPEVLRVNEAGIRSRYGGRHNHCLTSLLYREKVAAINERLARRYGAMENVVLWHVSNEYQGECHCPSCRESFRGWLRQRYESLDRLNAAWWGSFWSHRYSGWDQIDPPSIHGEHRLPGLSLAWKRFVTDQTLSFFRQEIAAIRLHDTATPVTTNFMGLFPGLDYGRFASELDVVSVNVYPGWHPSSGTDAEIGAEAALVYDLCRGLKRKPFLLMESTPSLVNWQPVGKLKRPGMNALASLQAIAHGSDSVQYFQWRKSRGGFEKFHGAVVDHSGRDDTRVFQEVAGLSRILAALPQVAGGPVPALAAVIHDWEVRWAFENGSGFLNDRKNYVEEIGRYHRALWRQSIPCDCIGSEADFSPYKLVLVPILYMVKPGVAERLEQFVRGGGTVVLTCGSGWSDVEDLVFEEGQPGPLRRLLGLRVEECDALHDGESVRIEPLADSPEWVRSGKAITVCERVHLETARPLARYASEFYSGEPCLTVNQVGEGRAYYVACRTESGFVNSLVEGIAGTAELRKTWPLPLPPGVHAQRRLTDQGEIAFLMNFTALDVSVPLPESGWTNAMTNEAMVDPIILVPYQTALLRPPSPSRGEAHRS